MSSSLTSSRSSGFLNMYYSLQERHDHEYETVAAESALVGVVEVAGVDEGFEHEGEGSEFYV